MQSPFPALLALYHIGVIGKIEIDYRHMHTHLNGTYVRLHGNLGSIDGRWDEYKEFLEVSVNWNSVANIKPEYSKQLEAWYIFAETEKKELKEFERLKKKFKKLNLH